MTIEIGKSYQGANGAVVQVEDVAGGWVGYRGKSGQYYATPADSFEQAVQPLRGEEVVT